MGGCLSLDLVGTFKIMIWLNVCVMGGKWDWDSHVFLVFTRADQWSLIGESVDLKSTHIAPLFDHESPDMGIGGKETLVSLSAVAKSDWMRTSSNGLWGNVSFGPYPTIKEVGIVTLFPPGKSHQDQSADEPDFDRDAILECECI